MRWLWFFHPHYPFVLRGHVVRWCCYCQGWGNDPRDTDACPLCYGEGFEPRR
jgi:DnaJ-class molecular chaperone